MAIKVALMEEEDIPGAVDCIQRAFADDPYNRWVFNDRSKFSLPRNNFSLTIRCRWGIRHALFYVAKDPMSSKPSHVLGVGCWLPPSIARRAPAPTWSSYLSGQVGAWTLWFQQGLMNMWYGRGGLNVQRYWIWKAAQEEVQAKLWTDDEGYYFCNIITVCPEDQGKGVGRLLVEAVTTKADSEGRRCYLESSRRIPNVAIYEKFGFKLASEMRCQDGDGDEGIDLFCMFREPHGAGET